MSVEEIWNNLLIGTDKSVITNGGFGKSAGLGTHPALLVIDPQYIYMGENKSIQEQMDRCPTAVGERAWEALNKSLPILNEFRARGLPVIFTRNVAKYLVFDKFATKSKRDRSNYVEGHPDTQLVKEVNLQDSDFVIDKSFASAFHGTPLISYLNRLGVDTIIVCGGVTSGCVRATVVDASSFNYRVAVPYECVFDRIELSHRASLFDMWMKYADLVNVDYLLNYLRER